MRMITFETELNLSLQRTSILDEHEVKNYFIAMVYIKTTLIQHDTCGKSHHPGN